MNDLYDEGYGPDFLHQIREVEFLLLDLIAAIASKITAGTRCDINPIEFMKSDSQKSYIARSYQVKIIEFLMGRNLPFHEVDREGNTPMDVAVRDGNFAVAEFLLRHVIQNLSVDKRNQLFILAIRKLKENRDNFPLFGYIRIAKLFLENGAKQSLTVDNQFAFNIVLDCLLPCSSSRAETQDLHELIQTFLALNDVKRSFLHNFLIKNILLDQKGQYLRIYLGFKRAGILSDKFIRFFERQKQYHDLFQKIHQSAQIIQSFWRRYKPFEFKAEPLSDIWIKKKLLAFDWFRKFLNHSCYTQKKQYNVYMIRRSKMIRTNIELDEKLVKDALKVTKIPTRKALIDYALRELLRHEKQKKLLKFRGKIHWEGDLNSSREGRN